MGEYFRGWKRKIGVATLVMACVFAAGWVRSIFVHDVLLFVHDGDVLGLWGSQSGSLRWSTDIVNAQVWTVPQWQNWIASEGVHPFDDPNIEWQWRCCGFGVADDATERVVPYWSITIPLTLISLVLLLSKPRKSTPKKITDPTTSEGT